MNNKLRGEQEEKSEPEMYNLWLSVPPFYRLYYNIKGGYFMRRKTISRLAAASIIVMAIAAYLIEQNPLVSIGLLIAGIVLGVVLIWEIESR